ncbi:NAD-dependent epimerase/dehydratase family protein [Polaromonas sp. JS666]|uniref:NAD-dependent epimerase/dehydratase family protein n=1 Tax=Polaromonas sp. (strain JS666 / ATCC BAA-500) TaxID=296591 RepID=UPI00088C451D|nr:NAD-dependent epimerase/dehydratase family protein [Polaromonas sp. JS666]SDN80400.1 UDP-glucose 4-epimerase [Polaromonas sp. JS666]
MRRDDVLLLGGAGFIGSALARRLHDEKRTVHILGRQQEAQLEQVLPQCGTVVHLACSTTPGVSAASPGLELGNLALTLRLLDSLKNQPQTHLIFFSSGGTVYGNPRSLPVTEGSAIAPLSNHGASKASQELFCGALRARGHAVTILRPSNAYGPGQTVKSGFGLVRTVLEHARLGTEMEIWGDGESVRDFIHVDDVAEACARLVSLPEDSGTYNLGSGKGHSVNEVLRIVESVGGREVKRTYRPARTVDVRNIVLDISRLETRLSWAPCIPLEEGVHGSWQWLLDQP